MVSLLIFIACALSICHADPGVVPRSVPPHLEGSSPRFYVAPLRTGRGLLSASATMTANIKHKDLRTMEVEVTWKNATERELRSNDWVGVYDQQLMDEFHAPIKFSYVFPIDTKFPKNTSGSLTFSLVNLRSTSYVFIYISGNVQYPAIIAQSSPISFDSVMLPMGVHIAISPVDSQKMLVMWTQNSFDGAAVKFGSSPNSLNSTVSATYDTYTKDEFCDKSFSPAGRQGWFEPGYFLTAEIQVQPSTTYYYKVGSGATWTEDVQQFTAPPAPNSDPTRLIIFADLGNAPADGSFHHSWDFGNRGELPSLNTTRLAQRLMDKKKAHAVVHAGDISYAVGYLSEWDEFMEQISPVASRIPWMASIGNHEMGWSESDPFDGSLETASDSGGECGVAFLKRFPYAMQPLLHGKPTYSADAWYSFNVGSVHFAMMSSEHDFRTQSSQWNWLRSDLQAVDRSVTPWVAVTFHRAMYIQSDWGADLSVAGRLQKHVEPLLLQFKVDFFFAGHHHSYQRFCKVSGGTCMKEGERGVYHFVTGMAGYAHSKVAEHGSPQADYYNDTVWGATYWEFNHTHATMEFLDGATDDIVDHAVFHKSHVMAQASIVI